MHRIDLNNYDYRTDMIADLNVECTKMYFIDDICISLNKLGRNNKYKKKEGYYLTIDFNDVTDTDYKEKVIDVFYKEIKKMLEKIKYKKKDKVCVIGLGNKNSTPDSLGPKTIENIIVTTHLFDSNLKVSKKMGNVSAFTPGVTGETGIKSTSYIKGVIKQIKPNLIIIIDALATNSLSRLNKSIQVSTTGIVPGSGIGNFHNEISKKTLNVPVLTIGVPTVLKLKLIDNDKKNDLMVTPKDIDLLINRLSDIISTSINKALHNI